VYPIEWRQKLATPHAYSNHDLKRNRLEPMQGREGWASCHFGTWPSGETWVGTSEIALQQWSLTSPYKRFDLLLGRCLTNDIE